MADNSDDPTHAPWVVHSDQIPTLTILGNGSPTIGPVATEDDLFSVAERFCVDHSLLPLSDEEVTRDCLSDSLHSWPTVCPDFARWVSRLRPFFSVLWDQMGLLMFINVCLSIPAFDPYFLNALLLFWCDPASCFIFPEGMLCPTLLDIAMLLGFPLRGYNLIAAFRPFYRDEGFCDGGTPFSSVIDYYLQKDGDPTPEENRAFLGVLFSKFFFCTRTGTMLNMSAPMIDAMLSGEVAPLAEFFLGSLAIGMNNLQVRWVDREDPAHVAGPFWFLHLWVLWYFPILSRSVLDSFPANRVGVHLAAVPMPPKDLEEWIGFFLSPGINDTFFSFRYTTRQFPMPWFLELCYTEPGSALSPVSDQIWNRILYPRPLLLGHSRIRDDEDVPYFNYAPQMVCSQLGLTQALPRFPTEVNTHYSVVRKLDAHIQSNLDMKLKFFSYRFAPGRTEDYHLWFYDLVAGPVFVMSPAGAWVPRFMSVDTPPGMLYIHVVYVHLVPCTSTTSYLFLTYFLSLWHLLQW